MSVFVCTAVGCACGLIIMRGLREKHVYLSDMCAFIAELKRNMAYRRDGAASVCARFVTSSKQLKKQLGEYIEYADGKSGELDLSRGTLSDEVYSEVCALFKAVGEARVELTAFGERFDAMSAAAQNKYKTYGAMSVKLGFLLGLGVGILML